MNLFLALVVAVLFGTGATLLLKPDLFRVVVGLVLVANAASLDRDRLGPAPRPGAHPTP